MAAAVLLAAAVVERLKERPVRLAKAVLKRPATGELGIKAVLVAAPRIVGKRGDRSSYRDVEQRSRQKMVSLTAGESWLTSPRRALTAAQEPRLLIRIGSFRKGLHNATLRTVSAILA